MASSLQCHNNDECTPRWQAPDVSAAESAGPTDAAEAKSWATGGSDSGGGDSDSESAELDIACRPRVDVGDGHDSAACSDDDVQSSGGGPPARGDGADASDASDAELKAQGGPWTDMGEGIVGTGATAEPGEARQPALVGENVRRNSRLLGDLRAVHHISSGESADDSAPLSDDALVEAVGTRRRATGLVSCSSDSDDRDHSRKSPRPRAGPRGVRGVSSASTS
eukprot:m51a1_g13216 hypothetical protein (224) ;mRNA; f:1607-2644